MNFKTVKEAFFYFFDDKMINFLLKYSNENLKRKNIKNCNNKYFSLKKKELYSYLAIYVYAMIMPITNIKYFWKKTVMQQKTILQLMQYKRFVEINQFLTVIGKNDKTEGGVVKKPKIAGYLFFLSQKALSPGKNLCIDESMMAFRGNLKNPAYSPMKNHCRGMKIYTLNESCSGYCLDQRICIGKSTVEEIFDVLLVAYLNLWHNLYIDNFYSSVLIVEKLLKNGIYVCGTLRYNRGEPKDFKFQCNKLQKQEYLIIQKMKFLF